MNEPDKPIQSQTETPDNGGGRRLAIVGVAAIMIALITSGISLLLYTTSGDIYLDRSRPGFISDDEPPVNDNTNDQDAIFSPDGIVTKDALDDYLQKLDALIQDITVDHDAFSADALSDEALSITGSADN